MPIDDKFSLTVPNKVVVVGIVEEGQVRPGDRLILRTESKNLLATVEGLEAFSRRIMTAREGDRVAVLLVGIEAKDIESNGVLIAVNTHHESDVQS